MRAVRLHGIGELRVEEVFTPGPPPPGYVRIRVRAAGICGSDLHNYRTGRWISRVPIIPGHELAGEILDVGAEVSSCSPGDLVVADSRVPCGQCWACAQGRHNVCERLGYVGEVCDGGFADFVTLPAARVLKVPVGISPRLAALSEPLSVALHVVRRLDPPHGRPILIAGAGPVGGLAAIILDHLGFGPLYLIERNLARAALVASLAHAQVVTAEVAAGALRATSQGLHHAIEATGSAAMVSVLSGALSGGGRLALVGIFRGECSVDLNAVVEKEIEVVGCSVFQNEQADALQLIAPLSAKLEQVISAPIALAEVPAEYGRLLQGESPHLKSMVCP